MRTRLLVLLLTALAIAACQSRADSPDRQRVAITRPVGSWQGVGNSTIGLISDSGRFRITWQTRNEHSAGAGTFRLVVHSAVSGRPIQVIADHKGEGGASANVDDDPRHYNLMIDSTGVEWSITVDEVVVVDAKN